MPRPATITIHSGDESPHSTASYLEPDSPPVGGVDDYQSHDSVDKEEEEVLHPSDSASTSNDISPPPLRATRARRIRHRVIPPPTQDQPPVPTRAPMPPHKVDAPEDYGHYGQAYGAPHAHRGGFYGGERAQHTSYPQHQHGLYLGNYPGGNQMVNYGGYAPSPFTNMSNVPNGSSYFGGEPRHSANVYDMMPYQQPGFFTTPQYALPGHLQQFQLSTTHPHQLVPAPAPAPAPAPPATEAPAKTPTPAPKEPPPDLEKIKLEAQVAAFKAVEDKARAAEEQREREAQIRKEAEEAFQRRAEELKKAQEEAQKEIQRARVEAERAARERIEAERKAEEERQKQQAEAMQRAEQNARLKFEAEIKAADAQRKKEEENRIRAEEAAQIRLEAAIKAKAEANAAAAKQAAEEAERIKMLQEEAKRRAELDTLKRIEDEKEAAKKAAAAADAAKAEQEAYTKRIREETKASLEAAAKKSVQPPIKFKDAVGRKFSFPFHLCSTWDGMEELIKQAFLQVDVLGPHVQEGHYDLVGPNGEIILPTVWDKVIQPDWTVTMTMWPVEKSPPLAPKVAAGRRPTGGHRGAEPVPPPPDWPKSAGRRSAPLHPNIDIVNVAGPPPKRSKSTSKHKLRNPAMIGFLAGFQSKKK
ncbi:hypothetical protein E4U35_007511 [Claviceps purpurea]|uniref:Related to kinetoplast-associated protein KAP n=1 Tax=Claviceps purpurea (strain 20.1) TaxID=1111077 RepID=M1VVS1_CLAP2|nr:hypothetical protein E4U51_003981 [Claviceps purpurea]CCE30012.1 related to kinetoplast-associated protein KAP [Claviceps purpurea 20.1]KAG6190389.1 hypothetical protein E4U36_003033 [Claviceps purpurea]KAG6209213.1 hypothetical protein E4U35_007511 [Claviceps purpurea]KAG6278300.1 hypothetical protein E4U48_000598 [Claviceps purpurea]